MEINCDARRMGVCLHGGLRVNHEGLWVGQILFESGCGEHRIKETLKSASAVLTCFSMFVRLFPKTRTEMKEPTNA